jgi:hypothetical protein
MSQVFLCHLHEALSKYFAEWRDNGQVTRSLEFLLVEAPERERRGAVTGNCGCSNRQS